MREWLRLNGTPPDELDQLNRGSTSMMERVQIAYPDRTLDGGEEIACGTFAFRVIWTPGHSRRAHLPVRRAPQDPALG